MRLGIIIILNKTKHFSGFSIVIVKFNFHFQLSNYNIQMVVVLNFVWTRVWI